MAKFDEGDAVSWRWGSGTAVGTVKSVFPERTVRKINGSEIVRNGSSKDPALYITQGDGGAVLKLSSEVDKA